MKKIARFLVKVFLVLAAGCMLVFTVSTIWAGKSAYEATQEKLLKEAKSPALSGSGENEVPVTPTPAPTPIPTPEPSTVPAVVKAKSVRAVAGTLARNDVVDVVDRYGEDCYVIRDSEGNRYYVEKRFIRTDEPAYGTEKSFFTKDNTPVYSTAYLEGTPNAKLKINSIFIVSDELNGIAFGSYQPDGEKGSPAAGYVDMANLSSEELSTWTECDGYISVDKTGIYSNPDLKGAPAEEVAKRAQVHAYERVGDALRIKVTDPSVPVNGAEGYISVNAFSKEKPGYDFTGYNGYTGGGENYWSQASGGSSDYTGGYDFSGSIGGGGGSGGGNSQDSGPLYGEDIYLAHAEKIVIGADFISNVEKASEPVITGIKGIVFSDGVELISAFYNKGDTVNLIAKDNDLFWSVLADHKACTIPAKSVLLEGEKDEEEEDPDFKETDGYIARDGVKIYNNPELSGMPIAEVAIRASVHAYEKVGKALHIKVTDPSVPVNGTEGYISADAFSNEKPGYTWETYNPGNGGGYDWGYTGGNDFGGYDYSGGFDYSGGGGSGGISVIDSGAEWSVPVL